MGVGVGEKKDEMDMRQEIQNPLHPVTFNFIFLD
jgi:hypothetical protein